MKPVVLVTDAARERILELRAEEEDETGSSLGLHISVTGENGPEYTYDLAFEPIDSAQPDDSVVDWLGLTVIVPQESVDKLQGATLDLPSNGGLGLVLRNPNRPDPLAGADIELTGEVPERINTLLEQVINPNLAMHGGFAELRAWEPPRAYMKMGGACQGCAVASITMRSGIEKTLLTKIPEIEEIIDTTDHASGTNPYYEASAK